MVDVLQRAGSVQGVSSTSVRSVEKREAGQAAFDEVLAEQMASAGMKLSAHAQERLRSRQISFGDEHFQRLRGGIERAERKGARESLVLLDDLALVVNVRNRTIITAMDEEQMHEKVFTNIDSAVIV